jgi:hypothetical protein
MRRTNLYVALASLMLTVVSFFSFKPTKKKVSVTWVYAAGYGYLFGNNPMVQWTSLPGHTAFFKTAAGPLVTLMTSPSMWAGKAYVH